MGQSAVACCGIWWVWRGAPLENLLAPRLKKLAQSAHTDTGRWAPKFSMFVVPLECSSILQLFIVGLREELRFSCTFSTDERKEQRKEGGPGMYPHQKFSVALRGMAGFFAHVCLRKSHMRMGLNQRTNSYSHDMLP